MDRLTLRAWWTQLTGPTVDAPTYTGGMTRRHAAYMDLCMQEHRPPGYQPTALAVTVQMLRNWMTALWWSRPVWGVRALVCVVRKRHNARMVDSHASPDHGYETFQCTRCGTSWKHTYY